MKAILKISVLSTTLLFSSLTFYSVPPNCEAAVTPVRIVQQIVVFSMPQNCEASVIEQLCSSVTSFLDEEAVKTGAAVKACKDKCGWKKRKNDLITAAQKKAKDSCSKGQAPDINDLNKGLDGNAKERLKSLYDRNNRMFDGTAKLPTKTFKPIPSKQAAVLTGAGGQVTDLKSYEPNTPKLNPTAEFSLSGTKLSGETPGQAATKQSPILLASASSAKSPAGADASAKTAVSAAAKTAQAPTLDSCAACRKHALETGEFLIGCREICCKEQVAAGENPASSECYSLCLNYSAALTPPLTPCECCKKYKSLCVNYVPGCTSGCGPESGIFDWWHKLWGKQKCCGTWFNPKIKCCEAGKIVDGKQCGAACYDPKTDCCVDGKKQERSSMHCKCQRIENRIKGVEGIIAAYNQGQKPKDGDSLAQTTCSDDVNGILTGKTTYSPAFYNLDPELREGIIAHEEIHRQQCETGGWWKWFWQTNFDKSSRETPAYQREKIVLEKTFREQCGK
ncbi:MAG: hypothetical protein HY796_05490 [Elusimicrobia bacterium]|nr:hypothetical protein [Elusimicrobiota bacterium]